MSGNIQKYLFIGYPKSNLQFSQIFCQCAIIAIPISADNLTKLVMAIKINAKFSLSIHKY